MKKNNLEMFLDGSGVTLLSLFTLLLVGVSYIVVILLIMLGFFWLGAVGYAVFDMNEPLMFILFYFCCLLQTVFMVVSWKVCDKETDKTLLVMRDSLDAYEWKWKRIK